jgi:ABC-type branched-subunit amino acid transport system permease subunit
MNQRNLILFGLVACLYLGTGFLQSWNLSLSILNAALLATIAALGVNMQWGYAGPLLRRHDGLYRAWRACGRAGLGQTQRRQLAGRRARHPILALILGALSAMRDLHLAQAAEGPHPHAWGGGGHGRGLLPLPRCL